jgi:YebC/PmpR family DNA-binding regulatory protein
MSGHSKWSTIKRKKGALDAKKGKIFSKLAKEIAVAAKSGGGDPNGNSRLRTVMLAARAANMPKDRVEAAIKKGTGEGQDVNYEEIRYEAYGPAGVAIVIDVLTDNKNRAVAEIRHMVTKGGGAMAESGAVMWNFARRGYIVLPKSAGTEDEIMEKALDAGADDVKTEGDIYEIFTDPADLHAVSDALTKAGLTLEEAKLTMFPKTTVSVNADQIRTLMKIIETIEDNDDVQNVYSNFEATDEVMAAAMAE